ncbi:MAG: outer membrane protein [Pedosphaera sp.]|nr:outer membrane protein [Pedosphaera sp.]
MKRYLMLISVLALFAGCASNQGGYPVSNNQMTTDAGYGSIPAPTQQGSGAYALSSQPQTQVGVYPLVPAPGAVGGYAVPAYGQSTGGSYPTPVQLSDAEIKFIQTAAQDGQAEIRMGQLAVQDGQTAALRNFGQLLITDHTRANQQLAQIAAQKGVAIPTQPNSQQEQMALQLSNLSGTDFDRSLEQHAIEDHEKDIRIYQDAANNLQDPDLKTFAQQTLPMLQQHLAEARQLSRGTTTTTVPPTGGSQ